MTTYEVQAELDKVTLSFLPFSCRENIWNSFPATEDREEALSRLHQLRKSQPCRIFRLVKIDQATDDKEAEVQ